jgi:diguanylate cyclase (GGDEF)-like protein
VQYPFSSVGQHAGRADHLVTVEVLSAAHCYLAEATLVDGRMVADVPQFVAEAGFDWPGSSLDTVMFWSAVGTRLRWSASDTEETQFPVAVASVPHLVRLIRLGKDRWAVLWYPLRGGDESGYAETDDPVLIGRPVASVLVAADASITWWNEAFAAMSIAGPDLHGRPLAAALPPDMAAAIAEVHADARNGELVDRLVTSVQPEPRWFRVHAREAAYTGAPDTLVVLQLEQISTDQAESGSVVDEIVRDALTGAFNRRALFDIAELDDPAGSPFASVLLADVRRFSSINDVWGQAAGDRCLVEVSRWLHSVALPGDVVVRLSGDEFLVLGLQGSDVASAIETAGELTVVVDGQRIPFTLRAGWTTRRPGQSLLVAAQRAERALAAAKRSSWRSVVAWTAEISRAATSRVVAEETVRRAISAGAIDVHFQPLVDVTGPRVVAVEALVRLAGATSGVGAETIINAGEQLGLMPELARMICDRAFAQAPTLKRAFPGVHIGINISRDFLGTGLAVGTVLASATAAGLQPHEIVLELTEEFASSVSGATVLSQLRRAHELGMAVMIDDFGRGETALSTLRSLPLAGIKLDRSLLPPDGEHGADDAGWAFVAGTASLLHTLAPSLVAEGVETVAQSRRLLELGISVQQGFLFGPPRPAHEWLTTPVGP